MPCSTVHGSPGGFHDERPTREATDARKIRPQRRQRLYHAAELGAKMEMSVKIIAAWSVLAITTLACGTSNPTAPTNSSVSKSASFAAPQGATPATDSQIPWRSQPITISVANGASTASG